jgi:hypothetical protein
MKREEDSDIHLVIADPRDHRKTIIVEFPASYCTLGAQPAARAKMSTARQALQRACGAASGSEFTPLRGTATIDGVGFFDFNHGQRGVAPNVICSSYPKALEEPRSFGRRHVGNGSDPRHRSVRRRAAAGQIWAGAHARRPARA